MEPPPLVIVEGFLGGAPILWGQFETFLNWSSTSTGSASKRRTMFGRVGPVSSLHDRACELYYCLKGGTVDYGQEHSQFHDHARYGRSHDLGLYPEWSAQYPLHFLGHSIGGPTIMKLQALLKNGHFGPDSHPDMLLSITSVSAPFRGTQLVYLLGECTDSAPAVRRLSFGTILTKTVHLLAFLSPFLPQVLDLHAESRSLSVYDTSFLNFLKQLWKSDWAESRDATPFDVTFEASDQRESDGEGQIHPNTFYRSHVASITTKASSNTTRHAPRLAQITTPPIYFTSRAVGGFDFSSIRPTPSFLTADHTRPGSGSVLLATSSDQSNPDLEQGFMSKSLGEEYWANDGVVPVFSQWHPLPCSATKCRHGSSSKSSAGIPEPGIWHVHEIDDLNHISVLPIWMGTKTQKAFWGELGDWLVKIDRCKKG